MIRRKIALAAALAATAAVAIGVVSLGGPAAKGGSRSEATTPAAGSNAAAFAPPAPPMAWKACGQDAAQCAVLRVPIDHADPTGPSIPMAVTRIRARLPKRRLGVLFVNPGGPGAAGIRFAQLFAGLLDGAVSDRFDIVGFDPRGVGRSAPIRCVDGPTLDRLQHLDPDPDNAVEIQALLDASKAFSVACLRRNPRLLAHVGTLDVVKDLDLLRIAMHEDKISYFGFSYGTSIGLTYAQLFPGHLRAMVLDGVLDPAVTMDERNRQQAIGFERNLTDFFADCDKTNKCTFDRGAPPRAAFQALLDRLDKAPLAVGNRSLGPAEFTAAVISQLYNSSRGWPRLAQLLAAAQRGNGGPALSRFDAYVDRHADGTYSNTNEANLAVNCLDLQASHDPAHVQAEAERLRSEAPLFGPIAVWYSAPCAYWPVPIVPVPVGNAAGSPPILVVGNTDDPATPYVWAKEVAARLANAVLVTYDHTGHTAYVSGPPCVRKRVDEYLVKVELPAAGIICR